MRACLIWTGTSQMVLLPLTLAPADHADESSHAVESHDAHSAGVFRIDAAVGMLQVLRVGVDEDRPREVLLC